MKRYHHAILDLPSTVFQVRYLRLQRTSGTDDFGVYQMEGYNKSHISASFTPGRMHFLAMDIRRIGQPITKPHRIVGSLERNPTGRSVECVLDRSLIRLLDGTRPWCGWDVG
jgi:hypothetical protein